VTRPEAIFTDLLDDKHRRTDRLFLYLLIAQWLFSVILASVMSPFTYDGELQSTHVHVKLAMIFGALINTAPIALIILRPGWWGTRQTVAVVQMLWSALLITISGGRVETHFHVFGSLAFLALYRDWKLILTATTVILVDHVVRGFLWPESVYGIANPEWWRTLEHGGWIAFEGLVLIFGCVQGTRELFAIAKRTAELEASNTDIERKIEERTHELGEAAERYRALIENSETVPFEYEPASRRMLYIAPQASRILHCDPSDDVLFGTTVHPEDRARVDAMLASFAHCERVAQVLDYRVVDQKGEIVHLRAMLSARGAESRIHGVAIDITKEVTLESERHQAQRLESVGRLAAGIAHEINTPIQFLNDSVRFVQSAMVDVMTVIAKHQIVTNLALEGTPAVDEARAVIEAEADIDLPFVTASIPEALDRAVSGIARVAQIVRSVKVFAEPSQTEMAVADLNDSIESTLTIARGEYKYVADLEIDLGWLPPVTCLIGELNQVVLTLVINAAHAIAEVVKNTEQRGTIWVSTRLGDDGYIEIAVRDSGAGIPDEIRDRVFEPLFTTKELGKGFGQGLATARATVVEKHHGRLTFESRLGSGTTFVIAIPANQAAEGLAA
jgi:signal transduction histidine kinase